MQILDSYKVNGRPFRFEELENGNFKRVWEGRNYDYMMKSDISGQNVRFYVETENGVAYPAELKKGKVTIKDLKLREQYIEVNANNGHKKYVAQIAKLKESNLVYAELQKLINDGGVIQMWCEATDYEQTNPIQVTILKNGKNINISELLKIKEFAAFNFAKFYNEYQA